jgi:hypothetical protein
LYIKNTAGSMVLINSTGGGGGGSGLTHFAESESTAAPNATVPVDAFTATDASYSNIDVALVAKGFGATMAQIPDSTTAGGNKRGQRSTDFQKDRGVATQVASGTYSGILAGVSNRASGFYSVVVGGDSNTASSDNSFVGGGQSNTVSTNTHATVCGGNSNTASGLATFIGSGGSNSATGYRSSIVGGFQNTNSGASATIAGGYLNTCNADFAFIAAGRNGTTRGVVGNHVFPACSNPIFDTQGATQSALLLLGRSTTDATATVLASNISAAAATNQVILPNNAAYYFKGSVIAGVTGGGDSKAWSFEGAIKRGATAASTAIVGSVVLNTIAQDAGASAWTIAITADTTNGAIAVTVTGAAATTIRWVAKIETTEMTY